MERMNRPHRRLDVWHKAMTLVKNVYETTEQFPDMERYGLASQMRRASVSVVSNIAEGAARTSRREFLQFISIARGSLSELEAQVEVAHMLGFLRETEFIPAIADIGRMLRGLAKSLRARDGGLRSEAGARLAVSNDDRPKPAGIAESQHERTAPGTAGTSVWRPQEATAGPVAILTTSRPHGVTTSRK